MRQDEVRLRGRHRQRRRPEIRSDHPAAGQQVVDGVPAGFTLKGKAREEQTGAEDQDAGDASRPGAALVPLDLRHEEKDDRSTGLHRRPAERMSSFRPHAPAPGDDVLTANLEARE